MKRAILVSSGTLAGLVAVLTYSGGDTNPIVAAAGAGQGAGLGGPPPAESTDPGTAPPADAGTTDDAGATPAAGDTGSPAATPAASAPAAATPAASPSATKAAAKPAAATTKAAAKPTPAATKAAPAPTPTKAAPKPTPTVAVAKDYVGSLQTHKYGKVQVGIRVKAGKIIAVWPVVYPNGDSQPYSDFSIPVFKSETLKAQSANIANVSGATLTWQSWKKSLQSAMAKAGI